jgi:hypothetical protein
MSAFGDNSLSPSSALLSDGLKVDNLAGLVNGSQDSSMLGAKFWASGRRAINDTHRDVMEVSFGSKRLINRLLFQLGHFPQVARIEYLDDNGDWQAVTYAKPRPTFKRRKQVTRNLTLKPVQIVVADSLPHKVDNAAITSTQHFGKNHWVPYSIAITPVSASKIRFVITRNPRGNGPVNPLGNKVKYSVAIRNLQIGYRVGGKSDLHKPPPDQEWWASSKDILGSRVVYSTYLQDSLSAIDGDTATYWRSEPQPFPFAVVNLFLDVRDSNGQAPVIDRFWVDPVTVGPICNVYYSDSDPTGDFDGVSSVIPDQWKTEIGNPGTTVDASTGNLVSINLGPDDQAGFVASNFYERVHYNEPWWVGVDARSLVDTTDTNSRPIVSMGTTQIVQDSGALKIIAPTGEIAQVDLDPEEFLLNSHFRLIAAYYPGDPASHRGPYLHLAYQLGDRDPVVDEISVQPLLDLDTPIKIGLHPDDMSSDVAAMGVLGIVVKSESLTDDTADWFFDEGERFVADAPSPSLDRGTAQNARLRMHPMFRSSTTNIFGVVGGPGDRFGEMEWTPVTRDFTLRRGYLHLHPKKAKYWKFEMTQLVPEVYENFVTIDREALVFPPDIIAAFNNVSGGNSTTKDPSGVKTLANNFDNLSYSDLLSHLSDYNQPDAASALIVKDPGLAQDASKSGWIWTYKPWHIGFSAPQFIGTQVHRYEAIQVQHTTKVAFFAGLREITPYRVDYTFDDDTPEYVEHMLDDHFIDATTGVVQAEGIIQATGANGEVTSKGFNSYRKIRAVQFATQETDAIQVLEDSDFVAPDLSRWTPYGDATLTRIAQNDVLVNRGWFANTWGRLEALYPTWGDLDDTLYGALEGNNPTTGTAEGGIISRAYTPVGSGKITAQVRLSADDTLSGPVIVEIIAANDSRVLASTEETVEVGGETLASVSYSNSALELTSGGGTHIRTWGDLEDSLGTTDVPANGAVTVASPGVVVGATPWNDADDATYATSTSTSAGTVVTQMSTVLPASPSSPNELTSVKIALRSMVDVPVTDPIDVRGLIRLKRTTGGTLLSTVHFDANTTATSDEVTILAPATPTGPADLGAAVQEGITVEVVIDSLGGPLPTVDRTLTVYELLLKAGATSTWGDLDGRTYASLEAYTDDVVTEFLNPDLRVRVRQQGTSRDAFHVHKIGLYESPISWFFSNDDGGTWWEAIDVRNNPFGVLMFPEITSDDPLPTDGKVLRWRARFYREGAAINALHIRPWYGSHTRTVESAHTMESLGPNQSIYDNMPTTADHPMWQPRFNPIEALFEVPAEPPIFWRNLVTTPSGEGTIADFDIEGGTIEVQSDWTYEVP